MASENINDVISLEGTPEGARPLEEGERKGVPVLPVRDTVLFPHAVLPLTVGRESSIQLINSLGDEKTILVVAQREARVDCPHPTDLSTFGPLRRCIKSSKCPTRACSSLLKVCSGAN